MRVTIKEIANALGVSPSTVSRALNNVPGVTEEVRNRVRRLAREMGYKPSAAARSLVTKRTGNIGLFIPRGLSFVMTNPFFAEVMEGIVGVLDGDGYNYVFCSSPRQYRKLFVTNMVDGMILFALRLGDPYIDELESSDVPAVVVGSYIESLGIPAVRPDDSGGTFQAVSHLIRQGHTRIGLLNGPLSSYKSRGCLQGYRSAFLEHGIEEDDSLLLCGEFVMDWGLEGARRLMGMKNPPTAVMCANDLIAQGVYRYAFETGLRIPEDLSVVGFGDFPVASYMTPPLTTVHTPLREMGARAASLLRALMQGEGAGTTNIVFPVRLVERQSTAAKHG
ncbi:MAG TPA: LacI family transcriptional regulator [Firmicutes bacterium]|nr:LacI family transcriptional regulator [Bacillota bacterium]